MTEGIIGSMKALEIVVVLNNSSTEGMVCSDALAKERDEALAKKEKLDKELDDVKSKLTTLEKRSAKECRILAQVKEAWRKLPEDKLQLEAMLHDATGPGPNEPEDLHGLNRYALVDKIVELKNGLVGTGRQSFDNVVDQLKVVNLEVNLCVEGVHFLNFVEGGVIVTPNDDDGVPVNTTM